MANSDKNIVITPNKGQSSDPEITFTGSSNNPLSIKISDSSPANLVIESTSTRLFSVDSVLTAGSVFSVSDSTGIPLFESTSTGNITVGGKSKPTYINGKGLKLPSYTTSNLPVGKMGDLVYDLDDKRTKYHDGSSWKILGTEPEDGGAGRGWSPAQGADVSYVIGHTKPTMRILERRVLDQGTSSRPNPLNYYYPGSTANFAFHTGHQVPSWWPTYFAVEVTDYQRGKVLNQIDWIKHSNAIGNVDMFGSNLDINIDNFTDENNWSFLGRVFMGGSGSAADGTVITQSFNPLNYGFKWYMIKGVDNNSSVVEYPGIGNRGGWAMYQLRLNKV
jgi:hypothetical protein